MIWVKKTTPDREFDEGIIQQVCKRFEVTVKQMESKNRKREIVEPRQIVFYLLWRYSYSSLKTIGRYFNRDHTTVIHGRDTVQNLIDTDDVYRQEIQRFEETLTGLRPVRERVSGPQGNWVS
jgi:chromosomal replication initiator protein